jgi:DNA polymerase-3 subunit gamma/tau
VIVDECHALSQQAWKSFLKIVEEPPPHLYWVFCTTEPAKVPETIRTRCASFELKPVKWDILAEYIEAVAKTEGLKIATDLFPLIARKANGSVRQALVFLAVLDGVTDKDVALELMATAEERKEVIDFIRWVCFGRNRQLSEAKNMIKQLQDQGIEAESIRIVTANYIAAAILGKADLNETKRLLNVLTEFSTPFPASDKYAPLLMATLSVLFS